MFVARQSILSCQSGNPGDRALVGSGTGVVFGIAQVLDPIEYPLQQLPPFWWHFEIRYVFPGTIDDVVAWTVFQGDWVLYAGGYKLPIGS